MSVDLLLLLSEVALRMAELDVGSHCAAPSCGRIDFLPLICAACERSFCKAHHTRESHACTVAVADPVAPPGDRTAHWCCADGCEQRPLVEMLCDQCQRPVCLSHRHASGHACPATVAPPTPMAQTAKHVAAILDSTPAARGRGGRTGRRPATAAKVALMQLKARAVGESRLAERDRFYLRVTGPQGARGGGTPLCVYVSGAIPVGRVIDQLATRLHLVNDNNTGTARRLRLFEASTGHLLPPSDTLSALASSDAASIQNGATVVLEFVDEGIEQLVSMNSCGIDHSGDS